MAELIFATLFSGSAGNAVYLRYGDDAILIDAGKNNKAIEQALYDLGQSPDRIRAVFITHEHSDHVSALPVFARRHPVPVHLNIPTAEALSDLPDTAVIHPDVFEVKTPPFTVRSFYTPHDSACSLGYVIEVAGMRFGVATDMGMLAKNVVNALSGCRAALIECNYDKEMLACGAYPPSLKRRISGYRGHLSNEEGALLCAALAHNGATHLLLGHLSRENNTPEKALAAVRLEMEKRGVKALVKVASRHQPTILLQEELL